MLNILHALSLSILKLYLWITYGYYPPSVNKETEAESCWTLGKESESVVLMGPTGMTLYASLPPRAPHLIVTWPKNCVNGENLHGQMITLLCL